MYWTSGGRPARARRRILETALAALAVLMAAAWLPGCGGKGETQSAMRGAADTPARALERGEPFPDVTLTGLDSVRVSTQELLKDRETVVLFISTSCETCAEVMKVWNRRANPMPENVHLLIIVDEDVSFAADWARKNEYRLPIYCDTKSVFAERHKMDLFPSAAAVGPDGRMIYVRRGIAPMFTPERAIMMMRRGEGNG